MPSLDMRSKEQSWGTSPKKEPGGLSSERLEGSSLVNWTVLQQVCAGAATFVVYSWQPFWPSSAHSVPVAEYFTYHVGKQSSVKVHVVSISHKKALIKTKLGYRCQRKEQDKWVKECTNRQKPKGHVNQNTESREPIVPVRKGEAYNFWKARRPNIARTHRQLKNIRYTCPNGRQGYRQKSRNRNSSEDRE